MPAPAGTIRADFGAPGPHAITVTKEARACDDLIHDLYADVVEATMNVHERPSCYDTFPGGTDSPIGVQFYYPTGVAEGTVASAPLMILSPGVGANAGMIDFSRTMLVGQSAGGGSVARMGGLLDGALNGYRDVDFRTAGFVAIMPGPADFRDDEPAVVGAGAVHHRRARIAGAVATVAPGLRPAPGTGLVDRGEGHVARVLPR